MAVTFRFSLQDAAAGPLEAARARALDLRPALRAIGAASVAQTRRRFLSGRAPDGSSWTPSRKPSGSTLIASGLLLRSISARPPSAEAVEVGSNRVYAGVHQTGGTIRAKTARGLRFRVGANGGWVTKREVTIPARPYLGASPADQEAFAAILLRHIGAPLGGAA